MTLCDIFSFQLEMLPLPSNLVATVTLDNLVDDFVHSQVFFVIQYSYYFSEFCQQQKILLLYLSYWHFQGERPGPDLLEFLTHFVFMALGYIVFMKYLL